MRQKTRRSGSVKIDGTEIVASGVGLGGWSIGGWMWGGTDEREVIRTIDAALDYASI